MRTARRRNNSLILNNKVEEYKEKFEFYLKSYVNKFSSESNGILESMEYTLMAPCKRLRPIIMIAFYKLFNGKSDEIYKFAIALEMIHTYSLIHDDLPCMDDGKVRRGKECNHIKFKESTALLAGDALITQAFEVISEVKFLDLKNTLECINILAQTAGSNGMVLGQYLDLNFPLLSFKEENVLKLYELKTAQLFIAAAKIGSILAGANRKEVELAEDYARNFGICFQIVDDLIDDEFEKKSYLSKSKLTNIFYDLNFKAVSILQSFNGDTSILEMLNEYIKSYLN